LFDCADKIGLADRCVVVRMIYRRKFRSWRRISLGIYSVFFFCVCLVFCGHRT